MKGKFYDTFQVERPSDNYLLLEVLHREKTAPRGFVVIKFDLRKTVKIVISSFLIKGKS